MYGSSGPCFVRGDAGKRSAGWDEYGDRDGADGFGGADALGDAGDLAGGADPTGPSGAAAEGAGASSVGRLAGVRIGAADSGGWIFDSGGSGDADGDVRGDCDRDECGTEPIGDFDGGSAVASALRQITVMDKNG